MTLVGANPSEIRHTNVRNNLTSHVNLSGGAGGLHLKILYSNFSISYRISFLWKFLVLHFVATTQVGETVDEARLAKVRKDLSAITGLGIESEGYGETSNQHSMI